MIDLISFVLILGGTGLALLAAVGLIRFPDVFARMHAATKAATLGLLLIIAGAAFQVDSAGDIVKLLLVAALMFVTAPVAAHMIARAAYRTGRELDPATGLDELAEKLAKSPEPPEH